MRKFEVHDGLVLGPEVDTAWDTMLLSGIGDMSFPDATCSRSWAKALIRTLLQGCEVRVAALRDDSRIVALLPLYWQVTSFGPFKRRWLRPIWEAHGGRCGVLTEPNGAECATHLLERLLGDEEWDVATLTVVEGSETHQALLHAAISTGVRLRCLGTLTSPYIKLASTWDSTFAALPKKMRWTIRKAQNDLESLGQLTYRRLGDAGAEQPILQVIKEIERHSWKEQSGTSITAQAKQLHFFEEWISLATMDGTLDFHALYLDDVPIAYILGALAGPRTFLDIKESFHLNFAKHSPSHVLKRFAVDDLISRGVQIYDFMGACEPYKMRWTDSTYRRLTYALYNETVVGRLSHGLAATRAMRAALSERLWTGRTAHLAITTEAQTDRNSFTRRRMIPMW